MKKLLAFLLAAVVAVSTVACSDDAVAVVNGKSITTKDYENQIKFTKWITELQYGDKIWNTMKKQDPNFENNLKEKVLDSLIKTRIFIDYSEKNNIKPDEKQLAAFKENNKKIFSQPKAKESFKKSGLEEGFMDKYAQQAATMTSFMKFIQEKSKPTEKEVKEYFDKTAEKVDASHILLSTKDKNGKPLSKEKIEEVKKKAEDIYNKAKGGEDFAKLAKEFSQDPGSAVKGGELGTFAKGAMVPEFDKTVFSMKVGEISKPIETQFGFHIIKLNKKEKEDFNKVKAQITQTLANQKAQELAAKIEQAAKVEKFADKIKDIPFGTEKSASKTEEKKEEPKKEEKKEEPKKDEKKEESKKAEEKKDNTKKEEPKKAEEKKEDK